jgi:hypothetical protein
MFLFLQQVYISVLKIGRCHYYETHITGYLKFVFIKKRLLTCILILNRFLRNLRDSWEHEPGETRSEVRPRRLTGEPAERERISQKSTLNNNTDIFKKSARQLQVNRDTRHFSVLIIVTT